MSTEPLPPRIAIMGGRVYMNLLEPDPNLMNIEDIASSLSKLCRFTGKCSELYTVAQHSILVSSLCPSYLAYVGLMHDAAEAYLGDVSKPLKQLLPNYLVIEDRFELALAQRFQLPYPRPTEVDEADRRAFTIEVNRFFEKPWVTVPPQELVIINALPHEQARKAFLDRFYELTPKGVA